MSGLFLIILTTLFIIFYIKDNELKSYFLPIQKTFSSLIGFSQALLMVYILSFIYLLTLNNSSNPNQVKNIDKILNYQACEDNPILE